jgi:hypothetical protein
VFSLIQVLLLVQNVMEFVLYEFVGFNPFVQASDDLHSILERVGLWI